MKELNGVNGTETPEEEEDAENVVEKQGQLPIRAHPATASRSMSPAVGRGLPNGHGSLAGAMSGSAAARASSPSRFQNQSGSARDSFLNYFFGKETGMSPSQLPGSNLAGVTDMARPGSRHVSQNTEPNFASSFRQGDNRQQNRPILEHNQDDMELGTHGSPFVGFLSLQIFELDRLQVVTSRGKLTKRRR